MRIGELAERSGTTRRMLRYYESQGLLSAARGANGYRCYAEDDVERARTIASLIAAGLPTRLVRVVLSAEAREPEWTDACDQQFAALLGDELASLEAKIACLTRSHAAVQRYLERANAGTGN